jgi:excisionase family DNA binding protein
MDEILIQKLEELEQLIREQNLLQKEMLTLEEAASYINVSKNHLYKMTHWNEISRYCPGGKKIYFNRLELNQWLQKNRKMSREELDKEAISLTIKSL